MGSYDPSIFLWKYRRVSITRTTMVGSTITRPIFVRRTPARRLKQCTYNPDLRYVSNCSGNRPVRDTSLTRNISWGAPTDIPTWFAGLELILFFAVILFCDYRYAWIHRAHWKPHLCPAVVVFSGYISQSTSNNVHFHYQKMSCSNQSIQIKTSHLIWRIPNI